MPQRLFAFMAGALALAVFADQAAAQDQATIVITADQNEAEVYLDGERVGLSPARVTGVSLGEHTARVEAGGRVGERRFNVAASTRTLHVPFTGVARPVAVGIDGIVGFGGSSAFLGAGGTFVYHLPAHEIGVAADWFNVQGSRRREMRGVIGRIEYAAVPWWLKGGPGVSVRPVKFRVRLNVAQTTNITQELDTGTESRDNVVGLGAGLGLGAEVQWRGIGIEPTLYYDAYALRDIGSADDDARPSLNNGGLNLRLKYYFP